MWINGPKSRLRFQSCDWPTSDWGGGGKGAGGTTTWTTSNGSGVNISPGVDSSRWGPISVFNNNNYSSNYSGIYRRTWRQADRQTERQTGIQTYGQTARQAGICLWNVSISFLYGWFILVIAALRQNQVSKNCCLRVVYFWLFIFYWGAEELTHSSTTFHGTHFKLGRKGNHTHF